MQTQQYLFVLEQKENGPSGSMSVYRKEKKKKSDLSDFFKGKGKTVTYLYCYLFVLLPICMVPCDMETYRQEDGKDRTTHSVLF